MSRERRRSTDPRAAVREQREHQRRIRHKRRPCGALPAVPTGLVGEFITRGRTRHERLLLRARWDEVTQDDAGNPIKVDGYNLEVEFSDDLGATWERHSRHKIPAKADDDPNTWAQAIVHRIRKRPRYRYRFRVEAFKGECRSGYSAFTPALSPTDSDAPPAPTNVRIFDKGVDRVVIRWDPPTDPDDPEMLHEDVQHFAAEISKFSDFSVIYDRDRYITKSRVAFKVDDADAGDTFYGRAWS
ncbi:MAG TPA: hypothetical protein VNO79_08790, partial [Actinomycetota bacterium]|nr:hypothetical protein [Actinomycetota bacterium]